MDARCNAGYGLWQLAFGSTGEADMPTSTSGVATFTSGAAISTSGAVTSTSGAATSSTKTDGDKK